MKSGIESTIYFYCIVIEICGANLMTQFQDRSFYTEIFLTTAAQRKGTRIVEQLFAESLAQISRGVIIDKYHVGQQKLRELSLMKQYYVRCAFSHNVASISV